jgi:hypothetical protein
VSDEVPKQHESNIQFLVRKRRFADCMILAWQNVEYMVDVMTVQEFDLVYLPENEDPRVDFIRGQDGFGTKLTFLKNMGRISKRDLTAIREFAKERHKLFHANMFTAPHPMMIPEDEKTRLMELAKNASQIVFNRAFAVWSSEETGDIGNKNLPRPDRPKRSGGLPA